MTLSFGERKLRIIQAVMNLEKEFSIKKIEDELSTLNKLEKGNNQTDNQIQDDINFWSLVQPIKEHISIEEMIKEQNYKPINKESFFEKASKINIEEPIEDLLNMLTK